MQNEVASQTTGINFLTNVDGERIAVVIDLKQHGELLETFFDVVISRKRMKSDERVSLADFKEELINDQKLSTDV